ncbi:LysR family transcriptional regulator [Pseudomonas helleri]|uniref:LysR family transcriptional regulator n=1 Tax=Pseudomonas helleri TaxID=1608996 RepID=A0A7X1Y4N0_9PSED|nr:LysR family transcriptional regulator [Pseudomonas helleri]MQT94512.1 LysR family transcriptional regulator [Pseudomonas helleri]MQU30494.1 LysR family transcriptional regulator [Pseudomonas helleri]
MKPSKTTLFDLYAVLAISTHRSFRKAADELEISASALSHAITNLEARMGTRLFNRTTRSVSLSEAGRLFVERISPAIEEIQLAEESLNAFRQSPQGTLRISASETAARIVMYPAFTAFLQRFPDMQVEIVVQEGLVDIVADNLDAGIRLRDQVPKDMIAVALGPEVFRPLVVASPDYLARHGTPESPEQLSQHNCLAYRFSNGQIYHWEFVRGDVRSVVKPQGNFIVNAQTLIVEAAKQGAGIAYVDDCSIRADIARGELVPLLLDWCEPFPGLALYYPGHRLVPSGLRALIDSLRSDRPLKN